jgi:hypothetical protein
MNEKTVPVTTKVMLGSVDVEGDEDDEEEELEEEAEAGGVAEAPLTENCGASWSRTKPIISSMRCSHST